MSQPVKKVSVKEINNYKQAKSGTGTKKINGPAKGNRGIVNPTKGGGIFRATKGRK